MNDNEKVSNDMTMKYVKGLIAQGEGKISTRITAVGDVNHEWTVSLEKVHKDEGMLGPQRKTQNLHWEPKLTC